MSKPTPTTVTCMGIAEGSTQNKVSDIPSPEELTQRFERIRKSLERLDKRIKIRSNRRCNYGSHTKKNLMQGIASLHRRYVCLWCHAQF